ncbi:MAG: hypothetical protein OHK0022_22330 [Roseiflexaceae bacterium]
MLDALNLSIGYPATALPVLPHTVAGDRARPVPRHQSGRWLHVRSPDALVGQPAARQKVQASPASCPCEQSSQSARVLSPSDLAARAEAAARLHEPLFQAIFDAQTQFIGLLWPDGTVIEANQTALDFGGLERAEVVGRPFWECRWWTINPQTQRDLRAAIERAAAGETVRYEVEVLGRGEATTVIDFSLKPMCNSDGAVQVLIPEGRVIAEQKRAEQALRTSEARYRRLFETSMDAIVLTDDSGHYLDVNDAACRMFGYTREQLLSLRVADLVVPEDELPDAGARFERYRQYGQETGTFTFYHTDGSLRVAGYSAVRLGPNLHQSILHDITAQRHTEEHLRLSEERFRNAFTSASIGMALVGLDGRWLQVNPAVCALTGYSEGELLRMTFQDITHPDDLSGDLAQAENLLRGEISAYQMEKRYIRKDDQHVWILLSGSLVRDAQGRPHHFIAQIQDISARKQAEAALRAALAEKEVLLKEIHHRVKNNLQMVASLLRLQAETLGDPLVRDIFRDSQNRINTMALTHEQLYGSEDLASVDLSHYLRRLVMQVIQSYERSTSEIELALDLEAGLSAPVDVMIPLGLILTELVSNSIKYAFRGRLSGQIRVVLRHAGPMVDLLIGDNGVGLPAGFDPASATTLGLQLVYNLAEQLEAILTIDRNSGTWFHLQLRIDD